MIMTRFGIIEKMSARKKRFCIINLEKIAVLV